MRQLVKSAIGRKMNIPVDEIADEEQDTGVADESPYGSLGRASAPVEDGGIIGNAQAEPDLAQLQEMEQQSADSRDRQAETNFAANMGGALSNLTRGVNAPTDQSAFYQNIARQGQEQAAMQEKGLERRAMVMRAMQDKKAKAEAALASKSDGNTEWDRRNSVTSAQALERANVMAGMRADAKAQEVARKTEDRDLQLAVPGMERTGEVLPKAEEAQKLRKASASAGQLSTKLKRLKELVAENGSFEYGGEAGAEMESLATEIQLLAKGDDMYQLGVLTGPDMSLLQKITADPASLSSLFTFDSTRNKQIDTQMKSIVDKLDSSAASMGYKKAGSPAGTVKIKGPDGKVREIPESQKNAAIAAGGELQ